MENGEDVMLKDKDIREPLFFFLEENYGRIRIIEEKAMGSSRADAVMVTPDRLYGLEIKSDADSYARLAGQVVDYDLYFDYNYIIVGTRHAFHVSEHVPDHWGIITVEEVDGNVDFYILRRPKPHSGAGMLQKLSLLWRPELQRIIERNLTHSYTHCSKKQVIEKLSADVSEETLRREISEELFERDYTCILQEINHFRTEQAGKKPRRKRRYCRRRK